MSGTGDTWPSSSSRAGSGGAPSSPREAAGDETGGREAGGRARRSSRSKRFTYVQTSVSPGAGLGGRGGAGLEGAGPTPSGTAGRGGPAAPPGRRAEELLPGGGRRQQQRFRRLLLRVSFTTSLCCCCCCRARLSFFARSTSSVMQLNICGGATGLRPGAAPRPAGCLPAGCLLHSRIVCMFANPFEEEVVGDKGQKGPISKTRKCVFGKSASRGFSSRSF